MRVNFTLDCTDLNGQARFWSAVLGFPAQVVVPGAYVALTGPAYALTLQRVPEPKTVKNRMHLDFEVDDLDATTARIVELGGSWPGGEHTLEEYRWRTVQDPEGNEFDITTVG